MSIKNKIALGFFISAAVIAGLVVYEYINLAEIIKEIRFLELTDTIRSKSLQLRRHEKNYFLFSPQKADEESRSVHDYLGQLKEIIHENLPSDKTGGMGRMAGLVLEYEGRFLKIESGIAFVRADMKTAGHGRIIRHNAYPLIEIAFFERPQAAARFLQNTFGLSEADGSIAALKELDNDIAHLRKTGEEIIAVSKELDKSARDKVDRTILLSQIAMFIVFPVFLAVGIGMIFLIAGNVTSRLKQLMIAFEETGRGGHPIMKVDGDDHKDDEVGSLIRKFNDMEVKLEEREEEIRRKNAELLQSKKLAAIGTLASGVAHELNNPLNNIYISAQVLAKETTADTPLAVREVVGDIIGQTGRVKRIVGDLLEFARGREPEFKRIDPAALIKEAFEMIVTTPAYKKGKFEFIINPPDKPVLINADAEQLERVFINLFMNAMESMKNRAGRIMVDMSADEDALRVYVADNGPGIAQADMDKIFEPFYTTKDKGTGLGLAIVFSIIKKHGGDITAESGLDKGTTFKITLPYGPEDTDSRG